MTNKRGFKSIIFIQPLTLALTLVLLCGATFVYSQDSDKILLTVDQYRAPFEPFVFDVKLTNLNDSIELTVHSGSATKTLIKFTKPLDFEGRTLLYLDENMWIYVPGTRRPLRISPNQRLFGGTSNADVARTVYASDYKVESSTDDGNLLKLELAAKSQKAAYAKIILFVDSENYKPRTAEYFASGGDRLLKTMYFEGYEDVLGNQRPMKVRVIDHIEGDSETIMQFSNMRIENTPDQWFQPTYLRRL